MSEKIERDLSKAKSKVNKILIFGLAVFYCIVWVGRKLAIDLDYPLLAAILIFFCALVWFAVRQNVKVFKSHGLVCKTCGKTPNIWHYQLLVNENHCTNCYAPKLTKSELFKILASAIVVSMAISFVGVVIIRLINA
ncbi:hypothetical protein KUV95_17260 [Microbulbifer agarilyticus]|uniref:hypothetical protein n=1 Tax=Microbulbifer agarilyticus TaxID=260552 RepID=UPI001C960483|nr:hypothetical protein [Microbulbifer agarilyticus]MBY6213295.1 hypothetical protein [Microbulbifer agarilyticus]